MSLTGERSVSWIWNLDQTVSRDTAENFGGGIGRGPALLTIMGEPDESHTFENGYISDPLSSHATLILNRFAVPWISAGRPLSASISYLVSDSVGT